MNKIMVCIICFFGINVISCVSINNKSSGSTVNIKDFDENKIKITAESLIDEFLSNEEQSQRKYRGKRITITGTIFEKATRGITKWPVDNPPPKDFNYIIFGNYKDIGICIQCNFNEHIYFNVNNGETLTVIGNFREINYSNIYKIIELGECKIDNN